VGKVNPGAAWMESHRNDGRDGSEGADRACTSSGRIRRSRMPTCHHVEHLPQRARSSGGAGEFSLTKTAQLAHVCVPRERRRGPKGEGTVTNSERRVQRVRKAVEPPGEARDELWIMSEPRASDGPRLGPAHGGKTSGTKCARAVAAAPGHELRTPRGVGTGCSGRAPTRRIRARSSCTRVSGTKTLPSADVSHPSPSCTTIRRLERPDDEYPLTLTTGPAPRVVQHRCAVGADICPPLASRRVARHLARGRPTASGSSTVIWCA